MGLFDLLFGGDSGSTVKVLPETVWISEEAKFKGISKKLQDRTESAVVLLIAHFENTLERLKPVADGYRGDVPLEATLAENLSKDSARRLNVAESTTMDLIVAERHPLLSVDDMLMEFAEELPCQCRIAYHVSLHDPVLKLFVGKETTRMLAWAGMDDDEPIVSSSISRRIKGAQQKLEATALENSKATSAAEWLNLNTPPT